MLLKSLVSQISNQRLSENAYFALRSKMISNNIATNLLDIKLLIGKPEYVVLNIGNDFCNVESE